ncbi:hypothetical protein OH76DRAFT_25533 [Lentinus brumalis]|uniref:Uncharacterized protein n=1 Tax=Lentinus brumalis TaxID=2498619 RepID=A0A371DXH1_9APHY|nr:hypothetical protein OH76DRAFT_25533 [Polyporus brumalis]
MYDTIQIELSPCWYSWFLFLDQILTISSECVRGLTGCPNSDPRPPRMCAVAPRGPEARNATCAVTAAQGSAYGTPLLSLASDPRRSLGNERICGIRKVEISLV